MTKFDEIRWVRSSSRPNLSGKTPIGLRGTLMDITEHKESERKLRETQAFLMSILDNSPSLIYVNTPDNRYRLVNKAWESFTGKTQGEVQGLHIEEVFSAGTAREFIKVNQKIMETGMPVVTEESVIGPQGEVFFQTVKFPLRDTDGRIASVCGISFDINQRKKAEEALRESEEKYRSLVESTEDSIYLVDGECRYLYMNKNHMHRFGLTSKDIIGRSYGEFHSKENTKIFSTGVNSVIKTGQSHRYVQETEKGDGHFFRTLSPVKDMEGRVSAVTVVSKDITEMIQAEEILRETNRRQLREQKRRKILSKRLIDLLENDRRQTAMELHDHIGQTLTSVKMDIETIQRKLKPEHIEFGARITAAQEKTIQAIKDVKIISHGLRPGMLEALGLVPSLRELFNEIQGQTDIKIRLFSRNVPKRLDPEKELAFYRIAQEAISNIVKHGEAERIFVNLVKKDKKLSLSIEDDGIGFDQKKVMKITKKKMPTGLLIMQERAEQLLGEFTVDSQAGKGTHLLVEIPV